MELLTRSGLAKRWKSSVRTIDRRRQIGLIPWVDLSGGKGSRPVVRFRLSDVEDFEKRVLQNPLAETRCP
jgi:hypothetical protein